MSVNLADLWDEDAQETVRVGDVVGANGKALDLRRLIQRRWGWPKKAAEMAVEHLVMLNGGEEDGVVLPISGLQRHTLQMSLIASVRDLHAALLEGIANRAQRESKFGHRTIDGVAVSFDHEIRDDGLVSSVLSVVANRLGVAVEQLREIATFQEHKYGLDIVINNEGLD